jgi:hypothetical protein
MPVDQTGTKRVFMPFIKRPQGATLKLFSEFLFLAKQLQKILIPFGVIGIYLGFGARRLVLDVSPSV